MSKALPKKKEATLLIPIQRIERTIYVIRGQRVMLDEDLAELYGVETRALNQAVRRNEDRFPDGFMFQLSVEEFANLKSQTVTSSWGGRRKRPLAFTEHGAVMLASVLRSKRAVQMSIEVVKAFVRLRQVIASHEEMGKQLVEIRSFILKQANKTDLEFKRVWKKIDELMEPPTEEEKRAQIGFRVPED